MEDEDCKAVRIAEYCRNNVMNNEITTHKNNNLSTTYSFSILGSVNQIINKISNNILYGGSIRLRSVSVSDMPSNDLYSFDTINSLYCIETKLNYKIRNEGKLGEKGISKPLYEIIKDIKNYRRLDEKQMNLLQSFSKKEMFDIIILFNETFENIESVLNLDS